MRIVRDTGYVKQRKRTARWTAILGFVLLTGTFWIALDPSYLVFSYVFLILGFIIFNRGMQQLGKWNRPVRNDQILDKELERLGNQYTLIHYPKLGKRVVEHLLVYPGVILVLTAKEFFGDASVRGRRWSRRGFGLRRILGLGGPQLGNPSIETDISVNTVEKYLEEQQFEADVSGAIVFTDERADIEAESPDYPILYADELARYVQELPADPSLRAADRQRLVEILAQGEQLEDTGAAPQRRPVRRRAA
jgi:hypothetical protein